MAGSLFGTPDDTGGGAVLVEARVGLVCVPGAEGDVRGGVELCWPCQYVRDRWLVSVSRLGFDPAMLSSATFCGVWVG